MKNNHIVKTNAIIKLKSKMLLKNTAALIGPLMAIAMTLLMKFLYSSMTESPEETKLFMGMALKMGVAFNIGMGAVMMTALPLAEDKEKNTLRALMTSSVNGIQFFIGSLVPPFLITIVVNYILLFVSGVDLANVNWLQYTLMTIVSALISCMLGLLLGIVAKSQVNANNIMMPFVLILTMIPMFSDLNESMEKVSHYLYTGIMLDVVASFVQGKTYDFSFQQFLILGLTMIVVAVLFVIYYKKVIVETE
ncbi:ABC transporter permease [Vagococcus sp. JNUCC 83]